MSEIEEKSKITDISTKMEKSKLQDLSTQIEKSKLANMSYNLEISETKEKSTLNRKANPFP